MRQVKVLICKIISAGKSDFTVNNGDLTDVTYYNEALKGLEAQLEELAKAEHFIFMEYHAIEDAKAWHRIQNVLEERVKAGVEVRVYSDTQGKGHFSVYMKKYFPLLGLYAVIFPESYDSSEAAAKAVRRYLYNV